MSIEQRLKKAFTPVQQAIGEERIPGAVLGVVTVQGERAVCASGHAQMTPVKRSMHRGIWFDLASLTKVIFTAPRVLSHCVNGRIALDTLLVDVLPDLQQYNAASWIRQITFAQCLSHQTAFPAVEPIYTYGTDPVLLRAFVLQRNWKRGPCVYSDINYILLGLALERLEGRLIREMALQDGFAFAADPQYSAATELCTWRGRTLCGEVHDENCFALQGAGHAGLFGTVDAVLDYALSLLDGGTHEPGAIAAMRNKVNNCRTYGWEYKHAGWSGGMACSNESIGHTGFTGTGLWIDFDSGVAWTLLTNRVHPTRHRHSGIMGLRRQVGELIAQA
ncbi:MAG: serine hydrolase domain-containing protein [Granulosicoccus sp.]